MGRDSRWFHQDKVAAIRSASARVAPCCSGSRPVCRKRGRQGWAAALPGHWVACPV